MKIKMIGVLALTSIAAGAAYAGPHCAKMKQAYHAPSMYTPAVMKHYQAKPATSGYAFRHVGNYGAMGSDRGGYGSHDKTAYKASTPDIVDTAVAAGSFNTLVKAVQAAGLEGTLRGDGPYTVFAPTDEAFANLPQGTLEGLLADKAKLTKVLTYHVVAGRVMAADLASKPSLKTVEGSAVPSASIQVSKADIAASNGVIHVVDEVLIPQM